MLYYIYVHINFIRDRTRRKQQERLYDNSSWYRYLNPPDALDDPYHPEAKKFRVRFRVPWKFYKEVLWPWTIENFPEERDCANRRPIPTQYKLLAVLRVLGRACHFDDVAEFANCGFKGEALRVFFHKWIKKFVTEWFKKEIKPPETEEEIRYHMSLYSKAGLDGAICSIDGVHFRWDKCINSLHNLHKGTI